MSPTPLTEIPNELVVFLVRSTCLSGNASCSTSSSTSSLPASRTRCEMTFCVEIWPSPIATNTASALARFNSSATPTNASGVSSVVIGRLRLRMARVSSSFLDGFGTAFLAEPLTNLVACLRALGEAQPITRRTCGFGLGCQYFNGIAILELGIKRHQSSVHARTHGTVTDFGVHRISEINRSGFGGKRDDLAFRREHVDLCRAQILQGIRRNPAFRSSSRQVAESI